MLEGRIGNGWFVRWGPPESFETPLVSEMGVRGRRKIKKYGRFNISRKGKKSLGMQTKSKYDHK